MPYGHKPEHAVEVGERVQLDAHTDLVFRKNDEVRIYMPNGGMVRIMPRDGGLTVFCSPE